ncbi:dienelactone hydrolase family protein [Aneurinibacillus tyrosinisolvens]|uniref:dienelactone hydrolase family protein n=1 Tax=Aneurinibacillus tyrosinisolvens TaxID=1443435 RepID=UPI00063F2D64|nr:dienelactone hydrolase family protein [Aneurinibacillus tyrosinisolvens]
MSLHNEWISFSQNGQDGRLYLSRPAHVERPLPAVIVIQEIWGTDRHIRELTDRIAMAGYLAVAPDLYAENGVRSEMMGEERIDRVKDFLDSVPPQAWGDEALRNQELEKLPAPERNELKETLGTLFGGLGRFPQLVQTLKATVDFLQGYQYSAGERIASVGFCMGGALSALLACEEPRLAGAVIYYGNLPGREQAEKIQCPVAGFFGGLDHRITNQVPGFVESMKELDKHFKYEIYEEAHHAFFNDTRASYNVDAARDAWVKTLQFFKKVLA